ncbi:MAG: hypothetical protein OXO54_00060 [Chloroflexota bacterium]|nr:hypothetical protein [Chloroflexota bacterium]
MNDVVEAHLGNDRNVGIYQRVFGDQAEQACQNDHRDDVRGVFAWAFHDSGTAPARGATDLAWPTTCVELNDIVEAHLGNDHNVRIYQQVFGEQAEAGCRSDHREDVRGVFAWAFSEAPVVTVEDRAPAPRIDPQLQPAWDLMASTDVGEWLLDHADASTVRVRVGKRDDLYGKAWYDSSDATIYVHESRLGNERRSIIASSLAHELWHAVSWIDRQQSYDACITEEFWAVFSGGMVWADLEGSDPWQMPADTDAEASRTLDWLYMTLDLGVPDYDGDISDWPHLTASVIDLYHQDCAHLS